MQPIPPDILEAVHRLRIPANLALRVHDKLDPALLRPGRLMGAREFRRLSRLEAQRLAEAKGLTIPVQQDYSLGEIYCSLVDAPALKAHRQLGFVQ